MTFQIHKAGYINTDNVRNWEQIFSNASSKRYLDPYTRKARLEAWAVHGNYLRHC